MKVLDSLVPTEGGREEEVKVIRRRKDIIGYSPPLLDNDYIISVDSVL